MAEKQQKKQGWIGVDLDGTLAEYNGWKGEEHIGAPIPKMVERVKRWLAEGRQVKIFTARVHAVQAWEADMRSGPEPNVIPPIEEWCREHIGRTLEVTNVKDFDMLELWDDRCIQVVANTGERIGSEPAAGGRKSSQAEDVDRGAE